MENLIMITKMTGQTDVFAMPSRALSFGLGLGTTGLSVATPCTVSGPGNAEGTRVETGLSRDWATFAGGLELRDERPTQAPKAVVAAAEHGRYAVAVGAGIKQQDQQIKQVKVARPGAVAIRMWAFRGPEPWSERT
ncbi:MULTISPECIES: hypothetical protein [Kitasatospora]|uniref:Uncharacterized protein n=2 Tax=Kitasatospora TaxID=2063 RepID=A0ABT1IQR4_9ACTN|nr:hypothetical protein [Kitasatospora paracochleata]MCP2307475.1 hypothetical protein [Kitasatospora paracochleata]